MTTTITFDKESKIDILGYFGKTTDKEGFIIEQKSRERVLTENGEPLTFDDFAGLKHGSLVFLKSDIGSIIDLADSLKD